MFNTLIWGFHHSSFSKVITDLEQENIIIPKIWVGKNKNYCTHSIRDFHAFNKVEKFEVEKDKFYFELLKELEKDNEIIMDMLSRSVEAIGKSYSELKNIYIYYLNYFYYLLKKEQIELILFVYIPHLSVEYILYAVAKKMNIRTIMLKQSLLPNRFFILESIDDFGSFKNIEKYRLDKEYKVEKRFDKDLFYMNKRSIAKISCLKSNLKILRKSLIPFSKQKVNFFNVVNKIINCRTFLKKSKKYEKTNISFDEKYVYFPLHLQPELTTSPMGFEYSDQLLAIEKLSFLLPSDWKIYIKENPKQLEYKRDDFFYERLLLLKNVVLVSKDISTYKLLKDCQFLATISGTAGWEAITGGKNVLLFGKTWYSELDGVFKYKDNIDLDTIIKFRINHDSLEKNFNLLMQKTRKGIIELAYTKLVENFNENENLFFVKEAISKQISKGKR